MFENILGHEKQKEILMSDIENNTISHAYIFSGPRGIGKRLLAQEFAKKLLNESNLLSNQDYTYISKNDDKKDILVGQVREKIIDNIYIKPVMSDYKVYLIDEAESLNLQAQNALLKTLEEPPYFTVIILITESLQKFLPTIISRVKEIKFNSLDRKCIDEYIDKNYSDIELDSSMLKYVNGSIGRLERLTSEEELLKFKDAEEIVKKAKEKNVLEVMKHLDKLTLKSSYILDYIEYILFNEGLTSKVFVVEQARNKMMQNGNENIIKTKMAIDICR